jgi:alpha/beta superfamily hydrolase
LDAGHYQKNENETEQQVKKLNPGFGSYPVSPSHFVSYLFFIDCFGFLHLTGFCQLPNYRRSLTKVPFKPNKQRFDASALKFMEIICLQSNPSEPRIVFLIMYPKGNLFVPASIGKLEAILKEPTAATKGVAIVCHPHPLGGGTMHNKVVFRVSAGLNDAGLATLRFNFRGVGSSEGEHDGHAETQDVKDVIDYMAARYPGMDMTLAGFSFGSRMGTEAAMNDSRVARLISIGTPVDKYQDYGYLNELRKPILFVHGDNDEFGSKPNIEALFESVKSVTDAELVMFEKCGHFFDDHLNELRESIKEWVERKMNR